MDLRVLQYFLRVAREGNITRAADALHITQPTLSRQIKELEVELGTVLFHRSSRSLTLTDAGLLFQQRARELVLLLDKTRRDLSEQHDLVGGTVSIGCVETTASQVLSEALAGFAQRHPMVSYDLYSANGDDIREKLDRGEIDLGILVEPVETAKYDYLRLPIQDVWGVLLHREHPLAGKPSITLEEAAGLPLILPRRDIVQEEIASWFGVERASLHVFATHNLLTNVLLLAKAGVGYPVCVQGAYAIRPSEELLFLPLIPERVAGHVLAWKKSRMFASATTLFIQYLQQILHI